MNVSRGFASLGLVLLLVVGLALFGGAGWYASEKGLLPEPVVDTAATIPVDSVFSASPTSGPAPLKVSFYTRVVGRYGADGPPLIDYGDGTRRAAPTLCDAPLDACTSPGVNRHVYATPGTYTARLLQPHFCTRPNLPCVPPPPDVLGTVTITVR